MTAHQGLVTRYAAIEKQHGRKAMLEEIARGGIEQMVEFDEEASPDEIYSDCYDAAFDALIEYGIGTDEAGAAAQNEASKFASP